MTEYQTDAFLTVPRPCWNWQSSSALRRNRIGFAAWRQRLFAVIASALRREADDFCLFWQEIMVENQFAVTRKGSLKRFCRSGSTCFQVLNFGNNNLHFNVGASCCPYVFHVAIKIHLGRILNSRFPCFFRFAVARNMNSRSCVLLAIAMCLVLVEL